MNHATSSCENSEGCFRFSYGVSKEFGGQWVALDEGRLIAHGPDAQEVYAAAKADGAYLPLIDYIESGAAK